MVTESTPLVVRLAMPTPTVSRSAFAGRLGQAMRAASVDKLELAQKVGAHPNRVGDWLRGQRWPSLDHLVAAASVLGVTVDWLLTGAAARRPRKPPAAQNREAVAITRDLARLGPRLTKLSERAQQATGRR